MRAVYRTTVVASRDSDAPGGVRYELADPPKNNGAPTPYWSPKDGAPVHGDTVVVMCDSDHLPRSGLEMTDDDLRSRPKNDGRDVAMSDQELVNLRRIAQARRQR